MKLSSQTTFRSARQGTEMLPAGARLERGDYMGAQDQSQRMVGRETCDRCQRTKLTRCGWSSAPNLVALQSGGFTLIELLTVLAIIGILAALLLPALSRAKPQAQRVACLNNLHQIGIAFNIFAHDHDGKFPMQVETNFGGVAEIVPPDAAFGELFQTFGSLRNELTTPKLLACPADVRQSASTFAQLAPGNVSYFVGLQSTFSQPWSVLAGNRNFHITNDFLSWTNGLHQFRGNLLFADTHVEKRNDWAPPPAAMGSTFQPGGSKSSGPELSFPSAGWGQPTSPTSNATPSTSAPSTSRHPRLPSAPVVTAPLNKPAAPDVKSASAPPASPVTIAAQRDEEPDEDVGPDLNFFKRLFLLGYSISLLWALVLLLGWVWKKLRERRALVEEARAWHAAREKELAQ